MKKIIYDKPKSVWSARVAFGAAVAGIATAVWWFTKSDYEPVRLLTPEEQAALRHDPARNPPPKNWEDSFITEKVPGAVETQFGNEWTRAAEAAKLDPDHPWSARDEIEKKICDLQSLERYRKAKDAWVEYQKQPVRNEDRFELLDRIRQSDAYITDITGMSEKEFEKLRTDLALRLFEEGYMRQVPDDSSVAYDHYRRMARYYLSSGTDENDDSRAGKFGFYLWDFDGKAQEYKRIELDRRIGNFIALYKQGLKPGNEGIKQYDEAGGNLSIGHYMWAYVPEEGSEEYKEFIDFANEKGLTLEEAKGLARFMGGVKDYQEKNLEMMKSERKTFKEMRGPEGCPS